jgi:hypothetical protein
MLRQMESFAFYFVAGVADERAAFEPVALPYCGLVCALQAYLSQERESNPFLGGNILKLYHKWADRLRDQGIRSDTSDLFMAKTVPEGEDIRPIGVSPDGH